MCNIIVRRIPKSNFKEKLDQNVHRSKHKTLQNAPTVVLIVVVVLGGVAHGNFGLLILRLFIFEALMLEALFLTLYNSRKSFIS